MSGYAIVTRQFEGLEQNSHTLAESICVRNIACSCDRVRGNTSRQDTIDQAWSTSVSKHRNVMDESELWHRGTSEKKRTMR